MTVVVDYDHYVKKSKTHNKFKVEVKSFSILVIFAFFFYLLFWRTRQPV